jgi:TRAP-type uncharacterized transport system substrate-binding protein
MVGKGAAQNVKDVLFLRGVDMGITQANILKHFARSGELGSNLIGQIAYVAKLFNEEMHVVVRADVHDIHELKGQVVNLGEAGSGTEITGHLVFAALGIEVNEVHLAEADAIEKLKSGEIAASVTVTGKPAPALASLEATSGLTLLGVPYAKGFESDYYPAALSHADYPKLIAEGETVDTIAVCAVLVSFNWDDESLNSAKIGKFVDRFFSKFDAFLAPPRHPKWREVNFAATLEGWNRSPAAQRWIDNAKEVAQGTSRSKFETFIAQTAQASGTPLSEAERASLFRAFLEWNKGKDQD